MSSLATIKPIIGLGAVLYCPFLYASCGFSMESADLYYDTPSLFRINLKIQSICAPTPFHKRELRDIRLQIFKGSALVTAFAFETGLWSESQGVFLLKKSSAFEDGCFRGVKSLRIDMASNSLNSVTGTYFNLKNGESLRLDCPELKEI